MTDNDQFGYSDPYETAREARESLLPGQPPGTVSDGFQAPWGTVPQAGQGPLGGLQDSVAAVLNANGDGNRVYFSEGPGEPVFQAPNPQYVLRNAFTALRHLFRR